MFHPARTQCEQSRGPPRISPQKNIEPIFSKAIRFLDRPCAHAIVHSPTSNAQLCETCEGPSAIKLDVVRIREGTQLV